MCAKPPYAERHVRWCERNGNESRSENFRFPTYSISGNSIYIFIASNSDDVKSEESRRMDVASSIDLQIRFILPYQPMCWSMMAACILHSGLCRMDKPICRRSSSRCPASAMMIAVFTPRWAEAASNSITRGVLFQHRRMVEITMLRLAEVSLNSFALHLGGIFSNQSDDIRVNFLPFRHKQINVECTSLRMVAAVRPNLRGGANGLLWSGVFQICGFR